MVIGILTMHLVLHGNNSLKGKRKVALSLKQKLRNKFNVAVSEIAEHDTHSVLVLAAVTVSNDANRARSQLQKALNMVEATHLADLEYDDIELIGA
ncbi:DUF503 domain-containing protein [Desulfovibrio inopinatus]|uniref:DUF503 domain-containing protein n=1 Tax=Desulfovibrio inopinatus TaxID=102109 RepID=UPI00040F1B34|nr:DUF503 domain-containing protein [Desulfovibrio inopinatus]